VTFSTAQNPSYIFDFGNFTVNLTASNTGGSNTSTAEHWVNVSVSTVQIPIAVSTLSRGTIHAGSYTWFNDTSTNTPTGYNWSFGDGTYAETANGTHYYSRIGRFNVSSTVTNGAGSNTSYNTIMVISGASSPEPPIPVMILVLVLVYVGYRRIRK
jgi:PKD repeat protein